MSAYPIPYRPDIDGLRAVAVLAVVLFHAWPAGLPGGFAGVDIFFVISGYLISSIIFKSSAEGNFSLLEFYYHRIRRIFPALLVVLISLLAVGWFILLADEYQLLGKHVSAGALFLANFAFWREVGYFDVQSELKPLLHLWSLGIEEQYYLLWPLVLGVVWRRGTLLAPLMVGLALVSFGVSIWLLQGHAKAAFYLPIGRAWELLVGAMLAWSQHAGYPRRAVCYSRVGANLVSLGGVLLVGATITVLDKSQPFPGWNAVIPVTGALFVIAAGPSAWFNRVILGAKPLVAIGLISYPLYLWHWPLLSLVRIVDESPPPPMLTASAVIVAALLAALTYFFVEKPIRRLSAAACAPMLAGLMVVVASLGALVSISNGVPVRMESFQNQIAQIKWALESDPLCQDKLQVKSRYCRISDPQRPVTAVIIGDSHANRLFEGLSPRFVANNGNLLQLGEGGCLPFWDLEGGVEGEPDSCRQRMNGQLNFVLSKPEIGVVFLAARGPLYISGHGYGDVEKNTRTFLRRPGGKAKPPYNDLYEQALNETVATLLAAGKKVVFVIDNPELGFNPLSCLRSRPVQIVRTPRTPCAVQTAMVEARNKEYRRIVTKVAARFPTLIVEDTQRALCDKEYCWAMIDGNLLYMDGDHLSRAGAQHVAARMDASLFVSSNPKN